MQNRKPLGYVALSATSIFLLDTWSPLHFAVAVLYIVVIVLAALWFKHVGILRTAALCAALTCLSFIITHGSDPDSGAAARTLISLAAITITTKLALFNIATRERLIAIGKEKDNLARFFPQAIVEQIATNDIALSTTRYEPAAVLFVDMIGFTKFCSALQPQDVIAMLRELLCTLSSSVFEHHGTVDKFTGDGLIAVFGLPVSNDLSATNAVRCALTMQARLQVWNDERAASGLEAVAVAIGIHYGDVVLGDVGCESRLELTVLGDTVNVASRVEHHCREARASILITDAVVKRMQSEGSEGTVKRFTDRGFHTIRGHSDALRLFAIPRDAELVVDQLQVG
ncbi:MAG: adenylate/guanylate cyclase domain-containing protein [Methylobacterium sp.]|uniref:adenylate/guanylate cyclase domain-containing protein n=1 Tax=Methylobacterium sp. TaxID=409 RepID=UPI0025F113DB|nr:adenylate/guanylate cyclase domain-containing protein [Methylobacterium sp.]MBX9934035.1 adenylate/guanylate cyclase domain-containing protein [Methylobacterium sp.]